MGLMGRIVNWGAGSVATYPFSSCTYILVFRLSLMDFYEGMIIEVIGVYRDE